MMSTAIEEFTTVQEEQIEQHYQLWLTTSYVTQPTDKTVLQGALDRLYAVYQLVPPVLEICSNPLEVIRQAARYGDSRPIHEIRSDLMFGPWEFYWLWHYKFGQTLRPDLYDEDDSREMDAWLAVAEHGHVGLFYEEAVLMSERPLRVCVDLEGRLHSEDGPALAYRDGAKDKVDLYVWHGVNVPDNVILSPNTITIEMINAERNTEVRRVLMERYGWSRYLKDAGGTVIDEYADQLGQPVRLWKRDLGQNQRPLVMLELVNSTPEPDGTLKQYMFGVPADMTSAKKAHAWHCGFDADEIEFVVQT